MARNVVVFTFPEEATEVTQTKAICLRPMSTEVVS